MKKRNSNQKKDREFLDSFDKYELNIDGKISSLMGSLNDNRYGTFKIEFDNLLAMAKWEGKISEKDVIRYKEMLSANMCEVLNKIMEEIDAD